MFKFLKQLFKPKEITKISVAQSITIDASEDMNKIIKSLKKSHKEYLNYNEILNIEPKDRYKIADYVWHSWAFHISGIIKNLIVRYPQYDKDILEFVAITERKRVNSYYRSQQYQKMLKPNKNFKVPLLRYYNHLYSDEYDVNAQKLNIKTLKLCLPQDIPNISRVWREENGKINHIAFILCGAGSPAMDYSCLQKIYLYVNGQEKEITKQELKDFCDNNNYEFPLITPKEYKEQQKQKRILQAEKFYNEGKISKEKYKKIIMQFKKKGSNNVLY